MATRQPQVFISYQRTDEAFARRVREHLVQHGVQTWMDQYDIPVGSYWPDEIDAALATSDVVVGILSPDAVESRNVKNEWDWAIQNGKRLVFVRVKPCLIPHRYVSINYIDATEKDLTQTLSMLTRALDAAAPGVVIDNLTKSPAVGRAERQIPAAAQPLEPLTSAGSAAAEPTALTPPPPRLPSQLTQLIGRERDLANVRNLLETHRLVTVTGAGGIGKTRLALAVAQESHAGFPDGVFFVDLAPITDPDHVASTIATVLQVQAAGSQPVLRTLIEYLRDKQLLLVLDNFERVVVAAPIVSELLASCPHMRCLVTSRVHLRLRGEQEYPLGPLKVPDLATTSEHLAEYAAAALFIQRTQDVKPDFRVTPENAPAVAEICTRLDGLPLAIELAAARAKLLTPEAMLARLTKPLALLTGGTRDAPGRQQTMRSAIAWSYDLLLPNEQRLMRQLSVFVGGWTLVAAEAVCDADLDVFEELSVLVDHSLVRHFDWQDSEPRFEMPETIREFGLECLQHTNEAAVVRERHAHYFLALAEQADGAMRGPDQVRWFAQLEHDRHNLREAIAYFRQQADVDAGLRLTVALRRFWLIRGHSEEDRQVVLGFLEDETVDPQLRAKGFHAAAMLSYWRKRFDEAEQLFEVCLQLLHDEDVPHERVRVLRHYGQLAHAVGDVDSARKLFEESLALARSCDDEDGAVDALGALGHLALEAGRLDEAAERYADCLSLHQRLGDIRSAAVSFGHLAEVAHARRDYAAATRQYHDALRTAQEVGDNLYTAHLLERLAQVALATHDPERAVMLLAASAVLGTRLTGGSAAVIEQARELSRDAVTSTLDDDAFARAWQAGIALSREDAVAYALAGYG